MTADKGLHTDNRDQLDNWLSQYDPECFLIRSSRQRDVNLLDGDAQQGVLRKGLPCGQFPARQFDNCLFWFPDDIPLASSVHLASSRIGKRPDHKQAIFDALRTFGVQEKHGQRFLITHDGTSLHEYTCRLGELFGVKTLMFLPFPPKIDSDWFRQRLNSNTRKRCYYTSIKGPLPKPDELLISAAFEVRVLSARSGGNVAKYSTQRLQSSDSSNTKTYFLIDSDLTPTKTIRSLQNAGAIDWWLYRTDQTTGEQSVGNNSICSLAEFGRTTQFNDFMIHWTRPRSGPWPGQTTTQFVDDLILGLSSTDHSRIASLCRIVASGQLLADNRLSRDDTPVVCFADVCVDEILDKRVFRPHLGRWDFEPCGIAIRKSVLHSTGVKPVIYGTDKTWEEMPAAERPYFQVASSKSTTGNKINWTLEKEHRVCGNFSLDLISVNDAFLFVESLDEAKKVSALSRWPVVVLAE